MDRPALGPEQCRALLACARAAIASATGRRPPSFLADALDATVGLDRPGRAFVTLIENGRLRGCMGSLDPDRSVLDAVVSAAIHAALEDPRFEPVSEDELAAIHVAVSVLGPDRPLASPDAFRPGVDGVIVERGWHVALLLPEVATEFGWDARDMLGAVCRKAGLPSGAWAEPGTRVLVFETVRFDGAALDDAVLATR
ncbi:MAG TPA: AmmeMemoRadiSam system protein A [Candidatus Limnocylindrales bacterium]